MAQRRKYNMPRELLRPQTNVPLIVRLDFGADGVPREGRTGTDYMYTVNDDAAIMFLPPQAAAAIRATGAQAGDEIAIVKRGAGARATWEVERVEEEPADAYEPPPPPRQQPARSAPATPTRQPQPQAQQPPAGQQAAASQLAGALCAAIDATIEAQRYAARKTLALQFAPEDIRAFALSIYIASRKEVR